MSGKDATQLERTLWVDVRNEFEQLFTYKFGEGCRFEVTADSPPSEVLKEKFENPIIFSFLRSARPDVTGYFVMYSGGFVTIEVKRDKITLENIAQAKMYNELFGAKYGFLVSTEPIQAELKELQKATKILNLYTSDMPIFNLKTLGTRSPFIYLARFDPKIREIIHNSWFPEPPFPYDAHEFRKFKDRPIPIDEAIRRASRG